MNNLHRELAPISDEAWSEIEDEARRTFKRHLAGRRVVDVIGPKGLGLAAVGTGHRSPIDAAADGVSATLRTVQAIVERRRSCCSEGTSTTSIAARDSDWQPVKDAARQIAFAEDGAIFAGFAAAGIDGIRAGATNPPIELPADVRDYPNAVAQAVSELRLAGVNGPYTLLLGAEAFTAVSETADHGYPIHEHLTRVIDGEIIWAPAIAGAFVLSTRGGDFELHLGEDLSIGYHSHDKDTVELYFRESLTFIVQAGEAGVALVAPAGLIDLAARMHEGIGLVVHHGRPAAVEAGERIRRWAAKRSMPVHDIDVWMDGVATQRRRNARDEVEAAGHPSLIVTVGGDGTFLRGARIAVHDDVPVLGVNVGRVGFLTTVEPAWVEDALDAVFAGSSHLDERMMLTLRASRPLEIPADIEGLLYYGRGPLLPSPPVREGPGPDLGPGIALDVTALNDIVFEKLARDRQASLGVFLNGTLFAAYSADALVVASPTGSTAYSFSAGGPILSPKLQGMVFTPVAPHMIFNRSVVLAPDERVSVQVLERSGQVGLSVDGQMRGVLDPGDWITVTPAEHPVKLVRLGHPDFYERLRERFSLSDAPAALADSTRPADPMP